MNRRLFAVRAAIFVGGLLVARPGLAQSKPEFGANVEDAVKQLALDVAGWKGKLAVSIVDVGSGHAVAELHEHEPMNPASNAKLATAATALFVLGEDHRYLTGLYGAIKGDAIDELVLRGEGDPSLSTSDLEALARDLKELGVKRVRTLLVDQSAFDDKYVPPAFEQQPNEWAVFRAPVAPVSLDENTVTMIVRPKTGGDAIVSFDPPGVVELEGSIKTGAKGSTERVDLTLRPRGGKLVAKIAGSIPDGGRGEVRVARRVDDPRLVAGFALASLLKDRGVEVAAEPKLGGERAKTLIASHRSARLGELVQALGKDSDNFYAEMIFKRLALDKKGKPAASSDAGVIVTDRLKAWSAFDAGMVIKNGSGLFDANRVTASATTSLLRAAYRESTIAPEYVAQLSVGGVDGTLKERFKPWASKRAIRAKTGTLHAVAALGGYVLAPAGKSPMAFSLLVDDIPGKTSDARKSMDAVVDAIAKSLWGNP